MNKSWCITRFKYIIVCILAWPTIKSRTDLDGNVLMYLLRQHDTNNKHPIKFNYLSRWITPQIAFLISPNNRSHSQTGRECQNGMEAGILLKVVLVKGKKEKKCGMRQYMQKEKRENNMQCHQFKWSLSLFLFLGVCRRSRLLRYTPGKNAGGSGGGLVFSGSFIRRVITIYLFHTHKTRSRLQKLWEMQDRHHALRNE